MFNVLDCSIAPANPKSELFSFANPCHITSRPRYFDSVLLGQEAMISAHAATTINNKRPRPAACP